MKNLILIITACFMLIGCATKKDYTLPKSTVEKEKRAEEFKKPQDTLFEDNIVEEPVIENEEELNKIAIIYPSAKVGRYAKSTISTISAYLIYTDSPFHLEAFDSYDENPDNILRELELLKEKGFTKVIAMFTQIGFNTLNSLNNFENIKFYFPLINKEEVTTFNDNFIFGGISYKKQLELLQTLSSNKNTMFYVKSYLGNKLRDIYKQTFVNSGVIKEIARTNNRYKYIMKDNRILGSTIILNTPIVKSSIILSQITAFEVEPAKVLSTQLNYNPLLVKLTQEKDRENFYVVSSIEDVNSFIEDYTKLLGSDIAYEWVDYSALVGANYLINENSLELIKTGIFENQADYKQTLYKSTSYGFEKVLQN
ncbi:hypothetical protein [Halarcobacter anaerophilus]|uniref:Uncharacterized protein n=1 Tax=Halarcobacter anaerophilus TaxID=877500 RepID=A0A4Q0XVP1_9BACT|nr:hypothetical protein [Halarcobacter anaerophilus]QDF28437.1 hypothetical protein AANAER_0946 [Halarcobacter anaerophilus]RXJ61650.1 hypothetical protein CRV06_12640 [Halarcobacter anaerophilus]